MRNRAALLLLLLPCMGGCGTSQVKVSGQVRYNGTPLPGGLVTFQPADGKHHPVVVALDEQGNFEATLPVGEIHASVDNRELAPVPVLPAERPALSPAVQEALRKAKPPSDSPPEEASSKPTKQRGKYVPIPPKYYSVDSSPLQFTVEPGESTHNLELMP